MNLWLQAALRPWEAFPLRQEGWPRALGRMLVMRTPWAILELVLMWKALTVTREELISMRGPLWQQVLAQLPSDVSVNDVREMLSHLPAVPLWTSIWPWLVALAPVLVVALWAHHAVWDHTFLWILRGVKKDGPGFKGSMTAEAQALEVGVIGVALGLLQYLPTVGPLLGWPLAAVGLWCWVLRGFALAKAHGAPMWKGVTATLLHGLVAGCCLVGCILVMVLQLAAAMVAG